MREEQPLICPTGQVDIFSGEGWTAFVDLPGGQISRGRWA
jgi:hypothetical protein